MKIYIASSFSLIDKVEEAAKELEGVGHEITVKWWTRLHLKKQLAPLDPDTFYNHHECKYAYERDFQGVKDSDILLFIAAEHLRSYNGANVELGIAFAFDKLCYSIGNLKNSALYYPVIRCEDIQDVIGRISLLKETQK